MKAVMISIQPKWCELIASGKKTIEVRKIRPEKDTPFKCYIYCTKHKPLVRQNIIDGKDIIANGKVIGEFVCDYITGFKAMGEVQALYNEMKETCLTHDEIIKYANGNKLYYWHISDLVIYDEPKEISEFYSTKCDMPCEHKKRGFNMDFCMAYENGSHFCKELNCDKKRLTRPPQSWCYVEEKENENE